MSPFHYKRRPDVKLFYRLQIYKKCSHISSFHFFVSCYTKIFLQTGAIVFAKYPLVSYFQCDVGVDRNVPALKKNPTTPKYRVKKKETS